MPGAGFEPGPWEPLWFQAQALYQWGHGGTTQQAKNVKIMLK